MMKDDRKPDIREKEDIQFIQECNIFLGELPRNSVFMPGASQPVENLARPGPFGNPNFLARPVPQGPGLAGLVVTVCQSYASRIP